MRIAVINDPSAPAALSLSEAQMRARLAGLPAATDIVVTAAGPDLSPADAEIVFACKKPDIAALKRSMPSLRWVQVISAGVEAILPTLPDDVWLTNASGVHGEKGGEFVLAAALMLNYRIPQFVADKAERRWQPVFATPAKGKRVTLLGVGGIGATAARRLRQNGFIVTGVTRSGAPNADLDHSISVDRLDEVLPLTDILVSTLPATPQTRGLIDRTRLESLPRHAGVIVVGRAAVVDYGAMAEMLTAGTLGGAVLDVYPVEPLPTADTLWDCPNLVMTPHCSVDDHETYMNGCLDIFVDNLGRFMRNEPLRNLIDRELGY